MGIGSRFAAKAAAKAAKEAAAKAAAKAAKLAVTPKAKPRQLALPAPPKQLALPAPGPGLPPLASKPRGGQFWTDRMFGDIGGEGGTNMSPEDAVRLTRQNDPSLSTMRLADYDFDPGTGHGAQLGDWLERTLTKYYKTDFGAPDDPLRSLAERGLHYDSEMTPERWKQTVNDYLQEDTIGSVLLPPSRAGALPGAGNDLRAEAMISMPWLAKQPVTDNIYGIHMGGLDLTHFTDEMRAAMAPLASGLPMDLAVRPESLGRMTFPQAVEQVGKINQYRAKEMERTALDAQNNPVTHVFKEYADDNPTGLKWVEMAPPKGDGPTNYDVEEELRKALKYEGDTMGHCVGGYCPDVLEGRKRIFSLRDAKGEPHVTIETQPGDQSGAYHQAIAELRDTPLWDDWLEHQRTADQRGTGGSSIDYMNTFREGKSLPSLDVSTPDNILQIKGKQNAKPKDAYIPFVRDFVQSGKWGQIGDEENSGMRRLGGNLIPSDEYDRTLTDAYNWMRNSPGGQAVRKFYKTEMGGYGTDAYKEADKFINKLDIPVGNNSYSLNDIFSVLEDPSAWDPENIESALKAVEHLKENPVELPSVFGGYAVGGRVSADRGLSKGKSAVYAVNKSRK